MSVPASRTPPRVAVGSGQWAVGSGRRDGASAGREAEGWRGGGVCSSRACRLPVSRNGVPAPRTRAPVSSYAWQGAVALAKSLKATGAPVLKELHIWSNHIGDVGRVAFEEALSTNN